MEPSAINCAQEVHDILSDTAELCFDEKRLPNLNVVIKDVVDELLDIHLAKVKEGINEYIQIQVGMIKSSDKKFAALLAKGSDATEEHEANDFNLKGKLSLSLYITFLQ
jgi:hypothetical protein